VVSNTPAEDTASDSSWRTAPEEITSFDGEYTADVVIVGGGQAGTPAARAAVEAGASVIVIESQAEDAMSFRGGGQIGHLNSEFLASKGIPTIDINEFVTDWQLRTNNRSRCGLVMAYAKNSGKCFDWMTDSFSDEDKATWSVRQWPLSSNYTQKKSGISTWVGTPTLNGEASPVKRCMEIAIEKGADYHYSTKACQLIKDGDRVVGVVGKDGDGKYIKFTANKGVILCGGGFGGNAEMCRDLLIEISDYCSADTNIGGMDDDGSGIQLGYWAGGRLESRPLSSMGGNYVYPCNSPGDPIGTTAALWVNCHGKRYCNEGFGDIVLSAMAGAKEPQGMLYTVFNDTIREDLTYQAPGHMAIDYANGEDESLDEIMQGAIDAGDAGYEVTGMGNTTVYAGKDAEELGTRMGFTGTDLENFIATVERYNELCAKGVDEDFAKEPVLLRPLNGEHIFAYGAAKSFGSMLVTTGGLLTDDNSQVLGEDFEPIEGLFAAGNNCGGRFGFQYSTSIPGESLGFANTQGMMVGQYVAQL
jgi:succinate dehydrogenase/fumarate reductase flavoprotein subunit